MLANTIDVVLEVEQVSGVLGQAAALLMASGLKYQKHAIVPDSDIEHNRLTLKAEGNDFSREDLQTQLAQIPGVISVLDIKILPKTAGTASIESQLDKLGRQLADELTHQWPRGVVELSQRYEDKFKKSEQERQVSHLGEVVGQRLARQHPQFTEVDNVATALQQLVLPLLENVAKGQVSGGDVLQINVSLFTRRHSNTMDLVFGMENSKCYFLMGFIQGILNAAPKIPTVKVTESSCRSHGDHACLFVVKLV